MGRINQEAPEFKDDRRATDEEQLAKYPDTVLDPAKAEAMAYASKIREENVVHAGKLAKMAVRQDGEAIARYMDSHADSIEPEVKGISADNGLNDDGSRYAISMMQNQRAIADMQSEKAGKLYEVNQGNSDIDAKVDALMKGVELEKPSDDPTEPSYGEGRE